MTDDGQAHLPHHCGAGSAEESAKIGRYMTQETSSFAAPLKCGCVADPTRECGVHHDTNCLCNHHDPERSQFIVALARVLDNLVDTEAVDA